MRSHCPATVRPPGSQSAGESPARTWRLSLVLAVVSVVLFALPTYAQIIQPDQRVTFLENTELQPDLAISGDLVLGVWQRGGFPKAGWSLSPDRGSTWPFAGAFPVTGFDQVDGAPTACVDQAGTFYAAAGYMRIGTFSIAIFKGRFVGNSMVWQPPVVALPFAEEFIARRPYDAPRLECDPVRGYLYLTYTRSHGTDYKTLEYTIEVVRSTDGGQTWSPPLPLSSPFSNGSQAVVGPDGELYVVWEDFAARQVLGRKSTDFGISFAAPFVVSDMFDNLMVSPGYLGGHQNPIYPCAFSDLVPNFPSLAVDRSSGPQRGSLYATWTEYAHGTETPTQRELFEVEPNGYFANAQSLLLGDEVSGAVLSSDVNPGGADLDRFTFEGQAGTTLRFSAIMTSLFPPPKFEEPVCVGYELQCGPDSTNLIRIGSPLMQGTSSVPPFIYTLPKTGRYYFSVGAAGRYSFGYRIGLRTLIPDANQAALDHRDIVLVSSRDGGQTWSPKIRVNDDPALYDNAFSRVAVDGLGQVHVAWYDRRDDPACGNVAQTYWAMSDNGATTFLPSRSLSRLPSAWRGNALGDYLALESEGNRTYALWTQIGQPGEVDVYGTVIHPDPTGIAVSGFQADLEGTAVLLRWFVSDPTEVLGFRVHRAEGPGAFAPLGSEMQAVRAEGDYEASDRDIEPGGLYQYRLEVVTTHGSEWQGPVTVQIPIAGSRLRWESLSQNPFAGSVRLALEVPHTGPAWVRIYEVTGREVATLHRGSLAAGPASFTWDGRDEQGRRTAPGVYVVRADQAGVSATRTLVQVR